MLLIYNGPDYSDNQESFSFSPLQIAETVLILLTLSPSIHLISYCKLLHIPSLHICTIQYTSAILKFHIFSTYVFSCQFLRLWVLSFLASTLKLDYIAFLSKDRYCRQHCLRLLSFSYPGKKMIPFKLLKNSRTFFFPSVHFQSNKYIQKLKIFLSKNF